MIRTAYEKYFDIVLICSSILALIREKRTKQCQNIFAQKIIYAQKQGVEDNLACDERAFGFFKDEAPSNTELLSFTSLGTIQKLRKTGPTKKVLLKLIFFTMGRKT